MKQKIKIAISIVAFIICLVIAQQSFALSVSNSHHNDPYTGKSELMMQGNPNANSALGGTFCIQKGHALRFSPANQPGDSDGTEVTVHMNTSCGESDGDPDAVIVGVETGIKLEIMNHMNVEEQAIAGVGSGIWYDYGASTNWNNKSSAMQVLGVNASFFMEATPYCTTPQYHQTGSESKSNSWESYLLSAGSWVTPPYPRGNYQGTVSDSATAQLIQDAIWCSPLNQGNILSGPEEAQSLLQEAYAYQNVVGELTNYNPYFLDTTPQVIVNQNDRSYTIGPYRINYLNDHRFSFIKDIYVIGANGNKVSTEVITSNGNYPEAGEEFFLKFNADEAGNPSSVSFNIEFAYLANTSASYTINQGIGDIHQFVGYSIKEEEEHETVVGTRKDPKTGKDIDIVENCKIIHISSHYRNVVIGYYDAQTLIEITEEGGGEAGAALSKNWGDATISNSIDLTMNLGGYVWVDKDGGKESIVNGIFDNAEDRVQNIIVDLYSSDNRHIASTTTDDNGQYRFNNLNAMTRYYVTFTYNGQYYEPTNYSASNTWGGTNWTTNSNATDIRNDRIAYNNRFETIGSSPENYTGLAGKNQTFTKQELLGYTLGSNGQYSKTRQPVMDRFGNLILENSSDPTTQKMIQYVKDCRIKASTGSGNGIYDTYPYPTSFVIDRMQYGSSLTPSVFTLYDAAYYINLGLHPRQESDLAIKKDIEKVTLEINGQKQVYTYNTLENKPDADGTWDISVRLSDAYYNTNYSREIYKSDYIYKVSNYGANFAQYGKAKADELEVYVTYKIMVRNQSLSIQMRVNELVDYFDQDYEYVDSRSYIQFERNGARVSVRKQDNSRYGTATQTTLNGYDKLYIEGLDSEYLKAGQTAYVYLTFKVKKDTRDNEAWLKLDENFQSGALDGVGKENIIEINGYSTKYAPGTTIPNAGNVGGMAAGIVDRDSNPGNINPQDVPKDGTIRYQNFEDDTDKAPNLRLRLYRDDSANRVIAGTVWEDERKENGVTATGDGTKQNNEKRINGVTVQLVELMENGTEFIWRTFENGSGTASSTTPIINYNGLVANYNFGNQHDGDYAFKSFIPGKYVVRFIYGDTVKTATPSALNLGGLNEKSYNGQDYKSTTYQKEITQNKTYTWRLPPTWNLGQEITNEEDIVTTIPTFNADASNNETAKAGQSAEQHKGYLYDIAASDSKNNVSDAKDIESRRNAVNDYSDNDVTNYIAEVLASHKTDYTPMNNREQLLKDLMANTQMRAETGVMVMEIEYNREQTGNQVVNNKTSYAINNVDLGLEERPKAQLVIDKQVTNVKLTLADGSILFDASDKTNNVLWKRHKAYSEGYSKNQMDPSKFGNLQNIRNKNASKSGLVQLTLDEELMHGATIQITYQITVSNIGEVDYKENKFYYTGNVGNTANVVTTKANQVIDYVANNLQFYEKDNSNWKAINLADLKTQGLINATLESQVENYNTIIITDKLNANLVPKLYKEKLNKGAQDSVSVPLVLTQVITSENDTDDLSYRNLVEIVKTSNTVGRRNEFSVVGNQDPSKEPQELDTDMAEVVKILPPFGNAGIYIAISIIVIVATGIIIGGIIFIKKKVLNK